MRKLFIALLALLVVMGGTGADCVGGGSPNASGAPGY